MAIDTLAQTLPGPPDALAGARWDSERPPYPGLESFAEDDAGCFSAGTPRSRS